jgi:N-acetylneuraminate lyase
VAAVFTPMHPDGSLNLKIVPRIVDQLIQDGLDGVYVCGSTGEGPSLSIDERQAVAEAYIQAVDKRLPVILQVGHDSLKEACRLARHAQDKGADAISAVPPLYFKPDNVEILVDFLGEIVSCTSGLPFYYYHIPRLTGVEIDVVQFLQLCSEKLPGLQGVKFSDFKVFELQACVQLQNGRYNLLFGSDEMLLAGLAVGAHGAIGTTYNFAAPLYKRIIQAFERNELAEAAHLQGLSVKMLQEINRYGNSTTNLPAMKAMMKLIGLDCGPLRLPLTNPTDAEIAELHSALQEIGFFEWGR